MATMRHPGLARNPPGARTQQQEPTQDNGTDHPERHSTGRGRACLPLRGILKTEGCVGAGP